MKTLPLTNEESRTLYHGLEFTLIDMNIPEKKQNWIDTFGKDSYEKAKKNVVDLQDKLLHYYYQE